MSFDREKMDEERLTAQGPVYDSQARSCSTMQRPSRQVELKDITLLVIGTENAEAENEESPITKASSTLFTLDILWKGSKATESQIPSTPTVP